MRTRAWIVIAVAAAVACTDTSSPDGRRPSVTIVSATASGANVLSAIVRAVVHDADSVRIGYHVEGVAGDSVTPAIVASDSVELPVFGLLPGQNYIMRVHAFAPGGMVFSDSARLTTGSLPTDMPSYHAGGSSPSAGFVVFAAGKYGVVIDNSGRIVWYHRFENGPGLNFVAQPNGRYAAMPPAMSGATPEWVEIDARGNQTRTFGCADDLVPRFHDLIRESDDSYWMLCDETQTMDLREFGGAAVVRVTGAQVQHRAADGRMLFRWSSFDHLSLGERPAAELQSSSYNWTHANALALGGAHTLLVSFRNLNEVIAIDIPSGAVQWRLGGVRSDYDVTCCGFARQHGLRVSANGDILFLDNSGTPGDSRAKRFALDVTLRKATLLAAHSATPPVVAGLGGSVQELAGGRMLVAFGDGRSVEEYDGQGGVVWRIDSDPGYVFRAQRIASLYAPGLGTSR